MLKWFALLFIAGAVLLMTIASGSDDDPFAGAVVLIVWMYGVASAIAVYVFFGWLQQTLHMLVGIVKNTASNPEHDLFRRLSG